MVLTAKYKINIKNFKFMQAFPKKSFQWVWKLQIYKERRYLNIIKIFQNYFIFKYFQTLGTEEYLKRILKKSNICGNSGNYYK